MVKPKTLVNKLITSVLAAAVLLAIWVVSVRTYTMTDHVARLNRLDRLVREIVLTAPERPDFNTRSFKLRDYERNWGLSWASERGKKAELEMSTARLASQYYGEDDDRWIVYGLTSLATNEIFLSESEMRAAASPLNSLLIQNADIAISALVVYFLVQWVRWLRREDDQDPKKT